MILAQWAKTWTISSTAIDDLIARLSTIADSSNGTSESAIQSQLQLSASEHGWRLWRNNVGGCYPKTGGFVRYGLANESHRMNLKIKSSDLIGIKPLKITEDLIDTTVGQFVAREVKNGEWKYSGTLREQAQLNFITLVNGLGGDAKFTNSGNVDA